jgi:hypothetical protein
MTTTTATVDLPKVRGRRPARVARQYKGWEIKPSDTDLWSIVREGESHEGYRTVVAAQKAIQHLLRTGC